MISFTEIDYWYTSQMYRIILIYLFIKLIPVVCIGNVRPITALLNYIYKYILLRMGNNIFNI